jgi:hypothetical protein
MLEKAKNQKAQLRDELTETPLNSPFSRGFETLMYLKQRKDAGLATTLKNIKNKFDREEATARGYLRDLMQISMVISEMFPSYETDLLLKTFVNYLSSNTKQFLKKSCDLELNLSFYTEKFPLYRQLPR